MNLLEIFNSPFFQTALLAGLLASIASGMIGSFVVVKRLVFLSGSIAHSVLSGMGLFLWLQRKHGITWLNPLYGAFLAAVISALLIGWIHLKYRQRKDAVIASIWASGMAIGVIFISLTPGYNVELFNFLFGNILWTTAQDLWMLFALDLAIFAIVATQFQKLLAVSFDEEQAHLQGIPVNKLYFLLLCLVAVSIVLLVQVIGTILVIALLALPPLIANLFTNTLKSLIVLSILFCAFFNTFGLVLSYELNWPIGATIALTATTSYFIALFFDKRKKLKF
ncbi:MAG: metal ABC transporter permease [Chlamydiae bacterium CG10_big_fil_rev_8_21_14_0_10_35_9]|nr:MAG: metal ABC transporter permease [Chlamydiae bacterium CG10_big_fil_rev_8_21_14_0_10_35_9]